MMKWDKHILYLFNKFRFQFHSPESVDFAIDIVIAIDQTYIFHFRSYFQYRGAAFYFKIFDYRYGIAVGQNIPVRVFDDLRIFIMLRFGIQGPFMSAFRANQEVPIRRHRRRFRWNQASTDLPRICCLQFKRLPDLL